MAHTHGVRTLLYWLLALSLPLLAACSSSRQPTPAPDGKLSIVATTTIVGDVVKNIGGDRINLTVLLPTGSDPHAFEPTPQDLASVSQAQILISSGAGLEEFMQRLLENSAGSARTISLSDDLDLLAASVGGSEEHPGEGGGVDPHVWLDPNNVAAWVPLIEAALSELDPANAAAYQANAAAYLQQLKELDAWIQEQVSAIPPEDRILVSDHLVYAYFARRYGFEQVGAAVPGFSTLAEPSAQELAALEDQIRLAGVKGILVGSTVNPALSERIARDAGIQVVPVYIDSLSPPGGPAATYMDLMRYNVNAIVQALR